MKTPASRLLDKLRGGKRLNGVSVRMSYHECVMNVLDHLKIILNKHIKKQYSDKYLVSTCFRKIKDFSSETEFNLYCKINLIICVNHLENIVNELAKGNAKISSVDLKPYSEILIDYLYDIKPIVEYLERKISPNYIFFSGGKNYEIHSMEIFRLSRQLAIQSAYRKDGIHLDHKVGLITSIFCLRQALEVRFERIIGVAFYNQYGETPKLRHGFHYDFICKNIAHFEFPNTKFDLIKYIYDWCNGVVHKAYMPYIWQVAYAHKLCHGLFAGGVMNTQGGLSVNGGVRTKQNDSMKSKFIQHFVSNYDHGIWSIENFDQEAVTEYYP